MADVTQQLFLQSIGNKWNIGKSEFYLIEFHPKMGWKKSGLQSVEPTDIWHWPNIFTGLEKEKVLKNCILR